MVICRCSKAWIKIRSHRLQDKTDIKPAQAPGCLIVARISLPHSAQNHNSDEISRAKCHEPAAHENQSQLQECGGFGQELFYPEDNEGDLDFTSIPPRGDNGHARHTNEIQ